MNTQNITQPSADLEAQFLEIKSFIKTKPKLTKNNFLKAAEYYQLVKSQSSQEWKDLRTEMEELYFGSNRKFLEIQDFIRSKPDTKSYDTFVKAAEYYRLSKSMVQKTSLSCNSPWPELEKEIGDFFAKNAYYFRVYLIGLLENSPWHIVHNALAVAVDISSSSRYQLCVSLGPQIERLKELDRLLENRA